jgi:isoleucyl-tRNA synthetase
LPWYSAYNFLFQNIEQWELKNQKNFVFDETLSEDVAILKNLMDKWITAALQNLIKQFAEEMGKYRLYTIVPKLLEFIENLNNWYVRLNRDRFKGEFGENEQYICINVLFNVILKSTLLLSPFVPFTTEMIYFNLRKVIDSKSKYQEDSIHFVQMPITREDLIDVKLEQSVSIMQSIIATARTIRERKTLNQKQPISSITILNNSLEFINLVKPFREYIEEEVNTLNIVFDTEVEKYVDIIVQPNHK